MHSIAKALTTGRAKYLDGISQKTHLEALDSVLYLARWARIREIRNTKTENEYGYGLRIQEEEEKPFGPDDIRFTEYPHPSICKRHLEEAVLYCQKTRGAKMLAQRMAKRIGREQEDFIDFTREEDIETLSVFLGRAKRAGFDTERMDTSLEKYSRLRRANIYDPHELRAALREYLPHRAAKIGDAPVAIAERELIGKDLPGFFPTPRPLISQMLDLADIRTGQRILEPSCGKGNILDALGELEGPLQVYAIEQNRTLAEVLFAKGYEVEFGDFLEHQGQYDRIVMNPPFESGADIDHVKHAFECLAPRGKLISVMSEGPFFRSDKKASDFQRWYGSLGGHSIKLSEDAFQGAGVFRQTGMRTRLIVIDKE